MTLQILAEPGSTHDGDLATMHRLIDLAADCGATAIKPQWTSSPERMVARRRAPAYLEAYRTLAYPIQWHAELRNHAKARGLDYVVSIYLPEDAAPIADYADAVKIASFEARDRTLLRAAVDTGRRVYVSTGMLTQHEAIDVAAYADLVLHCVSSYPAPAASLNLRAIRTLSRATGKPVGFSDHAKRLETGAFAVMAGAAALEVHMMLHECRPENPDYAVALDPGGFRCYVEWAREAETMLGDGVKRPVEAEAAMRAYQVAAEAH